MKLNNLIEKKDETCIDFHTWKYGKHELCSVGDLDAQPDKILVYYDKEYDLYGVVVYIGVGINLFWIPKKSFLAGYTDDVMNTSSEDQLYIVDETFPRRFNTTTEKVNLVLDTTFNFKERVTLEEFKEAIGYTDKIEETADKKEEISEEISENMPETVKNIPESKEDNLIIDKIVMDEVHNLLKELVDRELEVARKLQEVEIREKCIAYKEQEINEREYSLLRESEHNKMFSKVDAELVVDELDENNKPTTALGAKYFYDAILKVMKVSNIITIP